VEAEMHVQVVPYRPAGVSEGEFVEAMDELTRMTEPGLTLV
jgi:hypothetical protein